MYKSRRSFGKRTITWRRPGKIKQFNRFSKAGLSFSSKAKRMKRHNLLVAKRLGGTGKYQKFLRASDIKPRFGTFRGGRKYR